jgi:hypothetical protein
MLSHFSYVLFPSLLSWGSVDVPVLLAKVTRAREIATTVEVAHATVMLAAEMHAREDVAAWDSTALRVMPFGLNGKLLSNKVWIVGMVSYAFWFD